MDLLDDNTVIVGAQTFVIDKEKLLEIFKIGSMSAKEHNMIEYVENFLKEEKIEYTKDSMGNLYNFNHKDCPMICAHLDTVQHETDVFAAKFAKVYDDKMIRSYGVLGGDDKCGVYICMELLRYYQELNFCFCVQEETGMIGSKLVAKENKEKLKNIAYGLIFDRRGNSDIICYQNDYGTKEFEEELHHIGKYYGYKPARGFSSDANTFKEFFSCVNLSCGYYEPHSKNEYVMIEDVENALNYGADILYNIVDIYEPYVKTYPTTYYGYNDYEDIDPEYGRYGYFRKNKKTKEEEKEKKRKTTYTLCDACNKYNDTVHLRTADLIICKDCAKKLFGELINLAFGD